jgi:hypothetical protein
MHGRPDPLNGTFYSSAFLHFRPVDTWKGRYWFSSDNVIHIGNEQAVPLRPESILGKPWKKGQAPPAQGNGQGHDEL